MRILVFYRYQLFLFYNPMNYKVVYLFMAVGTLFRIDVGTYTSNVYYTLCTYYIRRE